MAATASPARVTHGRQSLRGLRLRGRAPRYGFLALVGVLSLLGLREVVLPEPTPPVPPPPKVVVDQAAQALAVEFARAYLTFDPDDPEAHTDAMAALAPSDLGDDAGAIAPDVSEPQAVLWAQPVQDQPALAGGRIITVAAQTSAQDGPVYLGVPVRRAGRGVLALGGFPSFVGAPAASTEASLPEREEVEDRELSEVARRAVSNYLAGNKDNLNADLTADAIVALPSLELEVTEVRDVVWADPARSAVLVTVEAEGEKGSAYTLTYDLVVAQQERWRVRAIEINPFQP